MSDDQPLVRIGIGQLAVARGPTILKATLGSCVGIALLWRARGSYGLAHCLLPESPQRTPDRGARYVDQAVASLLHLLQAEPAHHGQIEACVAGGGNMMQRLRRAGGLPNIGQLNIDVAMRELARCGIAVVSTDVGGSQARQMWIDCASGCVEVVRVPAPGEDR